MKAIYLADLQHRLYWLFICRVSGAELFRYWHFYSFCLTSGEGQNL